MPGRGDRLEMGEEIRPVRFSNVNLTAVPVRNGELGPPAEEVDAHRIQPRLRPLALRRPALTPHQPRRQLVIDAEPRRLNEAAEVDQPQRPAIPMLIEPILEQPEILSPVDVAVDQMDVAVSRAAGELVEVR